MLRSRISRIIAHVAVFFFIYSVQFVGSPANLGTRVWLGVIGLLLITYQSVVHGGRVMLSREILVIGLSIMTIVIMALITVVLNNTDDFAFVTYAPSMLAVALGAFAVSRLVRHAYPSDPGSAAIKILVFVVLTQVSLALLMFVIPEVGEILNKIQVTNDLDMNLLLETAEFRLSGFGARFFGAGIANCYALIVIVWLVRSNVLSRSYNSYLLVAFLIIAALGMMMSRTTMVGAGLAILYLVLPLNGDRSIKRQRFLFGLFLFILPVGLFVLVLVAGIDIVDDIMPLIEFGFELFLNYFEGGGLESRSTNELVEMFDFGANLPLLIGDGYFSDPNDPGMYYRSVDVGYLRMVYYFGLPGIFAYFLFQYNAIIAAAIKMQRGERRVFVGVCVALLFVLNVKGFADIFLFSVYLYFCFVGGAFNAHPGRWSSGRSA